MTYRVLVTGSRAWTDRWLIERELNSLLTRHGTLLLIHGAARQGADAMAHKWGLERYHASSYGAVTLEPHPADWKQYGRSAGIRRNVEMVEELAKAIADGAEGETLAFIAGCVRCGQPRPHGSHGATHCADLADKTGIKVRRWFTYA